MKKLLTSAVLGMMVIGMAVPSFAATAEQLPNNDFLMARTDIDSVDVWGTGRTNNTDMYTMEVEVYITTKDGQELRRVARGTETNVQSLTTYGPYRKNVDAAFKSKVSGRYNSKSSRVYRAERITNIPK